MKRYYFTLILVVFIGFSSSCQKKFNQKIWLENNDTKDIKNPRIDMVDDVLNNYVEIGMKKRKIIKILGPPLSDTIGAFLPKEVKLPDSLSVENTLKLSKEEQEKYLHLSNEWYKKNYKSAPMIRYPLGWSLMDPVFLEIIFNEKDEVVDFWVKQS